MGNLRKRGSYANVIASLALFVALGGTSVAAVALSRNSVKSKHIKNGQVKRADLARNAVTTAKVAEGSLLASDFRPGQLPAAVDASRFLGRSDKAADADLLDGTDASAFLRGRTFVEEEEGRQVAVPPSGVATVSIQCAGNSLLLRGAYSSSGFEHSSAEEAYDHPFYVVRVTNHTTTPDYGSVSAAASCVELDPAPLDP